MPGSAKHAGSSPRHGWKGGGKFFDETFFWRVTALIVWIVWLVSFLLRVFVIGLETDAHNLLTPERYIILHIIFLLTLSVLIVSPLTFRLYAVCFCLCALTRLIDGDSIIGLLMYLLSGVFSMKQGFFRQHPRVKLTVSMLILCGAIASQLRYGVSLLLNNMILYMLFLLILLLAAAIFLPEIKKLQQERKTTILTLQAAKFSERDVKILRRVLSGAKYDAIAREESIALITFKKLIHDLFYRIGVGDRTNFLARYSNYTIRREGE